MSLFVYMYCGIRSLTYGVNLYVGWQYAAFYDADTSTNASIRYVSVARRDLSASSSNPTWEKFTLTDYNQTLDDGHDMCASSHLSLFFDRKSTDWHIQVSPSAYHIRMAHSISDLTSTMTTSTTASQNPESPRTHKTPPGVLIYSETSWYVSRKYSISAILWL